MEQLEKFTTDVAHELKNPLTAIKSSSELLLRNSISEENKLKVINIYSKKPIRLKSIYNFINNLFQIPRSITGDGVRETLGNIKENYLPSLNIYEIPTGEKIEDWTVPKEWNIKDAYILDPSGKKIVDFDPTFIASIFSASTASLGFQIKKKKDTIVDNKNNKVSTK